LKYEPVTRHREIVVHVGRHAVVQYSALPPVQFNVTYEPSSLPTGGGGRNGDFGDH
jgi:hypothetical protein